MRVIRILVRVFAGLALSAFLYYFGLCLMQLLGYFMHYEPMTEPPFLIRAYSFLLIRRVPSSALFYLVPAALLPAIFVLIAAISLIKVIFRPSKAQSAIRLVLLALAIIFFGNVLSYVAILIYDVFFLEEILNAAIFQGVFGLLFLILWIASGKARKKPNTKAPFIVGLVGAYLLIVPFIMSFFVSFAALSLAETIVQISCLFFLLFASISTSRENLKDLLGVARIAGKKKNPAAPEQKKLNVSEAPGKEEAPAPKERKTWEDRGMVFANYE